MSEHREFLIARRRNMQRSDGGAFLLRLGAAVPPLHSVAFVDASRALEFEHKLLECVKAGTLDGTVQRTTGLSRTEVLSAWRRFVRSGADTLFVLCSNYRDFLFVANRDVLNDVDIIDLVTFDEDTVHFASPSLDVGFGVDRYHDSVAGWIYEIDAWGCQNPVQG